MNFINNLLLSIVLETPLSCACIDLLEPRSMIMTLVNGGAHLDFRTRNGSLTPLHKSAIHYRKESIVVR
jgi:SH3/ankyrin repeat-containing protein